MLDNHFYHYVGAEPTGFRRIVIPFRRLLHRLLRPMFGHQAELYRRHDASIHSLSERQDRLNNQLEATRAVHCDYTAMVRRLAALEEHVEALLQRGVLPESGNGIPIPIEAAVLKGEESGNGEDEHARALNIAC
jgi:hypothetical protein